MNNKKNCLYGTSFESVESAMKEKDVLMKTQYLNPQFVKIQDPNGTVYNTVYNPAVVFDKESGTWHKIGEFEDMKEYYQMSVLEYKKHNLEKMANDLVLLELPLDQELIDNIFQITGFIKNVYSSIKEGESTE